jgi:hypothetical protein
VSPIILVQERRGSRTLHRWAYLWSTHLRFQGHRKSGSPAHIQRESHENYHHENYHHDHCGRADVLYRRTKFFLLLGSLPAIHGALCYAKGFSCYVSVASSRTTFWKFTATVAISDVVNVRTRKYARQLPLSTLAWRAARAEGNPLLEFGYAKFYLGVFMRQSSDSSTSLQGWSADENSR